MVPGNEPQEAKTLGGQLTATAAKQKPAGRAASMLREAVMELHDALDRLDADTRSIQSSGDTVKDYAQADNGAYPGMGEHVGVLTELITSVQFATNKVRTLTDRLEA